jgi:hypothetical protein
MRNTQNSQSTLKVSVYALQSVPYEQYIALRGAAPKFAPLHLATIAPATEDCRACLEQLASRKLAGVAYELVRVDP